MGGAEKWVLRVAQHYDAKIYCTAYEPEQTFPEFKSLKVSVLKNPIAPMLFFLPKKIRENIAFTLSFALFKKDKGTCAILCCTSPAEFTSLRNRPVIWYSQSPSRLAYDTYDEKVSRLSTVERMIYAATISVFRAINRVVVRKLSKIFANSKNVRERIRKYLGLDSEVLYQGISAQEFGFSGYSPFFFYPSRITPAKRFEFAIAAFLLARKKQPTKKYGFVLAGFLNRSSKEDLEYLGSLRKRLGGAGKIIINPDAKKLKELYATCFCTLYSPKSEDFGLIPLESAASRKTCIGVNEGGIMETIINGETGFLVNTPGEMAERMGLLMQQPKLAVKMGGRAHMLCKERFSWKKFFSRIDFELDGLMKKKR